MSTINNAAYTNEQKLSFAKEIFLSVVPAFEAGYYGYQYYSQLKKCLQYWAAFVPFPPRQMAGDEAEATYIESLYDQLRPYVFEWTTNHRLLDLEKRIESLESPTGESGLL